MRCVYVRSTAYYPQLFNKFMSCFLLGSSESSIEENLNLAKKVEGAISNSVNALIPKLLDDIEVQTKEVTKLAISKIKSERSV